MKKKFHLYACVLLDMNCEINFIVIFCTFMAIASATLPFSFIYPDHLNIRFCFSSKFIHCNVYNQKQRETTLQKDI